MTWVDLVVLGVLLTSAALAFMRGLVREVLSIGAWVGAVVIAIKTLPTSRDIAARWIDEPAWLDPIGFIGAFMVALIVLALIARLIGRLVRGSALGGIDRSLGLLFGLARGAALVVIAYILGSMAVAVEQWPDPVLKARSLGMAYEGATWLARQMPEDYRPQVTPPPTGREATADALMRAVPQGRATGGRASDLGTTGER
jgi:membrane protein required for colicin V production